MFLRIMIECESAIGEHHFGFVEINVTRAANAIVCYLMSAIVTCGESVVGIVLALVASGTAIEESGQ